MARLHVVVDTPDGRTRRRRARARSRARRRRPATGSTTSTTRSSTRWVRRPASTGTARWRDAFPRGVPGRGVGGGRGRATSTCSSTSIPRATSQLRLEPPRDDARRPHQAVPRRWRAGAVRRDAAARAPRRHRGRRAPVRDRRPRRSAAASTRSASSPRPATRSAIRRRRRASPRCSSGCGRARSRTTGSTGSCSAPGSTARDVVIVRALCQYLRQAGVRFTDAYLADTLARQRRGRCG